MLMLRVQLQRSPDPDRANDHAVKLLHHESLRQCDGSHSVHRAFHNGLGNLTCTCNSSHTVLYSHGVDTEVATSADVTIYGVGASEEAPLVNRGGSSAKFLLYLEPPHNLEFTSAPSFEGLVGFRRPEPGETLGTWYPWCPHQSLWRGVRAWQYEPRRRNDIGIWISNCDGYPEHWRTSVIDLLLASGLPVNSYGLCRRNSPKEYWDARVGSTGTTRDLPDGSPGLCRRHRLMLAVENNACRDWVSRNLCQVPPDLLTSLPSDLLAFLDLLPPCLLAASLLLVHLPPRPWPSAAPSQSSSPSGMRVRCCPTTRASVCAATSRAPPLSIHRAPLRPSPCCLAPPVPPLAHPEAPPPSRITRKTVTSLTSTRLSLGGSRRCAR